MPPNATNKAQERAITITPALDHTIKRERLGMIGQEDEGGKAKDRSSSTTRANKDDKSIK